MHGCRWLPAVQRVALVVVQRHRQRAAQDVGLGETGLGRAPAQRSTQAAQVDGEELARGGRHVTRFDIR